MSITELEANNGITKAQLLRSFDEAGEIDDQLLESMQTTLKETLTREDWINYAVLCKQNGEHHKKILDKIPYSDSWIKKYVNPKLKEVTLKEELLHKEDTNNPPSLERHFHPLLDFSIGEIRKATRRFSGWGSVEVKDSQSDKLPIDGLKKIMPTYMQRGSPIMFGHSNRHVGKILKYDFRDKNVTGKKIPGLWLEGLIFNNYKIDDQAWESIQLAKSTAKPVLSLGATPVGEAKYECEDNECFRKFDDLQIYEFTVTDLVRGQQGANPEATVDKISLAKADKEKQLMDENDMSEEDTLKAFRGSSAGGSVIWKPEWGRMRQEFPKKINAFDKRLKAKRKEYEHFRREYDSMGKDYQAKLKRFNQEKKQRANTFKKEIQVIESKISELRTQLESIGKSDGELAQQTATELMKAIDEWTQFNKTHEEIKKEEDEMEITKEEGQMITDLLEKLSKSNEAIMARLETLEKAGAPPPAEEEEEDDKKKFPPVKDKEKKKADKEKAKVPGKDSKEAPDKEPVLALSEHGLTAESFDEIAKKMGYSLVGKGPAPDVSTKRDMTKGSPDNKGKMQTAEESIEALLNGDLSTL